MTHPSRDDRQARGIPIERLEHVPVSSRYLAVMRRVLEEHGARLHESEETLPAGVEGDARMYEVTFPPGTTRINGLVIHRSVPFELIFPDGYQLHGSELWPITLRESDGCLNGLMLSPEEVRKQTDQKVKSKREGMR